MANKTESKVWSSKAETDACFDGCSETVLEEIANSLEAGTFGPSVVYATHNASSIQKSLKQMRAKGLISNNREKMKTDSRVRGRVTYAQLLGMTDK